MYKVKAPAAAAVVGTLEPDDNKDHRSETSPNTSTTAATCLYHSYVRNNHQISCQLAAEAETMLNNISWGQKQQLNYLM